LNERNSDVATTGEDIEPTEESVVDKGYGYEMKNEDEYEMPDPLDELLDAYAAAVRLDNGKELADKILALVPEVGEMFKMIVTNGMGRRVLRGHGYESENPVKCLIGAYEAMLMFPQATQLRAKVMELIHEAEAIVYATGGMESDNGEESMDSTMGMYEPVRRVIRQEGDQFCVYSEESGRAFGCYVSRAQAEQRLAQIESFANARMSKATMTELVDWHDRLHEETPDDNVKTVHDLIEDELEQRGLARPYVLTEEDKLALVERSADIISKAAEHRYTLGPVYVPNREDAHGEFTDSDTLQAALWEWVRKGDRRIFLQHGDKVAGEAVEVLTWPFAIEAELGVPGQGVTKYAFPANTPFMGVVWESWAWEKVKAGELRGYSIGGRARRMEADLPLSSTI